MRKPSRRQPSGVKVRGMGGVMVRFAKCCRPVPGDAILGFITQGKGVSVHRVECPNASSLGAQPDRIIDVNWDVSPTDAHIVDIEIEAADRSGLLQDVMSVLSEHKTNATSVTARTKRDGSASISCSLEIRDLNHLSQLLSKLNRVRDVRTAYRVTKREARAGDR